MLVVAALFATARVGAAQSCNATNPPPSNCTTGNLNNPATITIPRTLLLTMSATTTSATTTIADFDNTYIAFTGPTATINANRPWTLLIRSTATIWTNVGTGSRANKPVGDLRWSTSVAGTFVAMTTTNATVATGAATTSTVTSLFFRTLLDWTLDRPGQYTINVTMTMTTP